MIPSGSHLSRTYSFSWRIPTRKHEEFQASSIMCKKLRATKPLALSVHKSGAVSIGSMRVFIYSMTERTFNFQNKNNLKVGSAESGYEIKSVAPSLFPDYAWRMKRHRRQFVRHREMHDSHFAQGRGSFPLPRRNIRHSRVCEHMLAVIPCHSRWKILSQVACIVIVVQPS